MSLVFSDTSGKDGIIQTIERTLFGDSGDGRISGNTVLLAQFTADINIALDRAFHIIFTSDGRWQFDDSNHTDYPIITTNLVASQRDYSFTTDENANLILSISKILIKDTNGVFREIESVDQQSDTGMDGFWDGQNITGIPDKYDKTANGIFLDPIPSYNSTGGLKIFISREASYFTVADTTKKAGFMGLYHEYLALQPAYKYAYRNSLSNAGALRNEVLELEASIIEAYKNRAEDDRIALTSRKVSYK